MADIFRDAPIGQLIRLATGNRLLQYPEEKGDFACPNYYKDGHSDGNDTSATATPGGGGGERGASQDLEKAGTPAGGASTPGDAEGGNIADDSPDSDQNVELEKIRTVRTAGGEGLEKIRTVRTVGGEGLEKISTRAALSHARTQADLEEALTRATMPPGAAEPIIPEKTEDGTTLVDWYNTDDPANPQNWTLGKKSLVTLQICLYTTGVYMGSAIYSPSIPGVIERFGVSPQAASLGLSMYVLAYGLGPMIWSPLSEIPAVGRNPPYMATFAIFVILIVPTALADNYPGFVVLRFLLGFFGSPCLATGGASMQDLFSFIKLPYVISIWALAATCGPALGPIISGFSVTAENWRWSQWEMLWLAGPVWLLMFFTLPETYGPNILLRRAARLRKITGNPNLKAQSEIDQANMVMSTVVFDSLVRPLQLMVLDPAIAFATVYTSLLYGIYYSFFEAFPIVFGEFYRFNMGVQGLAFLSITVGVFISLAAYWSYIYFVTEPDIRAHGLGAPEKRLIPAMYSTFLAPIGLFIFAWTAAPTIPWIAPIIGIATYTVGIFIILQCIFMYLPLTYPQYAASLFAGNDLARSTLAAGAIHFSSPLFRNLGIGDGVSILGSLTAACCFGIFALYFLGAKLRARSKFAAN